MRLCLPYSSLLIYVSPIICLKGNYGFTRLTLYGNFMRPSKNEIHDFLFR